MTFSKTYTVIILSLALLPARAQAKKKHHARTPPPPAEIDEPATPPPDGTREERACMASYKEAQELEQSGRLRDAQESLQACAKAACGSFLHHACTTRYTQLDADIPSVVPLVTDDGDAPRADVQVKVDGQTFASRLDGRALPVDPGVHEFTFSTKDGVFATQKLMIVQGQRNRQITVPMHVAEKRARKKTVTPAPDDEPARPSPPVRTSPVVLAHRKHSPEPVEDADSGHSAFTWVLGTVSLAGLAGYGVLTYWGRKDNDLLASCSPNCPEPTVKHIRQLYLGANVSLGVGLAALGAAIWVYAASGPSEPVPPGRGEASLRFALTPTSSGAVAAVAGSF